MMVKFVTFENRFNFMFTGHEDTQVINLPVIDSISPRPPYLPLSIPKDLEPRLSRLHGDPIVWWIGQILKYLFKPQPKTREFLTKYGEKIGFQKPIVGYVFVILCTGFLNILTRNFRVIEDVICSQKYSITIFE